MNLNLTEQKKGHRGSGLVQLMSILQICSISPKQVADLKYSPPVRGVILHTRRICTLVCSISASILAEFPWKQNDIETITAFMTYIVPGLYILGFPPLRYKDRYCSFSIKGRPGERRRNPERLFVETYLNKYPNSV